MRDKASGRACGQTAVRGQETTDRAAREKNPGQRRRQPQRMYRPQVGGGRAAGTDGTIRQVLGKQGGKGALSAAPVNNGHDFACRAQGRGGGATIPQAADEPAVTARVQNASEQRSRGASRRCGC